MNLTILGCLIILTGGTSASVNKCTILVIDALRRARVSANLVGAGRVWGSNSGGERELKCEFTIR